MLSTTVDTTNLPAAERPDCRKVRGAKQTRVTGRVTFVPESTGAFPIWGVLALSELKRR